VPGFHGDGHIEYQQREYMSESSPKEYIHTRIWREEADPKNAFAASAAYCHGYDVAGEMLGSARWVEMLYLLFRGEVPSRKQADFFEALAVTFANPGPRDPSVHAAMCAGVCGSTAASSLIAALAVGAGGLFGGRDVLLAMQGWVTCGTDLTAWRAQIAGGRKGGISIWPDEEHVPGYDPHGDTASPLVRLTLAKIARLSPGECTGWLEMNCADLEAAAGGALSFAGVAAAALHDLGFTPEQGEILYLLLRLPGAAAHALEQRGYGFRKFPFFEVELEDGPVGENA
jgi:citrate synthase